MREYDTLLAKGAISYSRMVELLNEKVQKYAKQKAWEAWFDVWKQTWLGTFGSSTFDRVKSEFETWWEANK